MAFRLSIKTVSRRYAHLFAWTEKHPTALLTLILLVSLIINIASIWIYVPAISPKNIVWQTAVNVAHGRGYVACLPIYFPFCGPTNEVTAAREPAAVILFSVAAMMANDSPWAALMLQLCLNLAMLPLVFIFARQLAGTGVALLATLFWSFYIPAVVSVHEVDGTLLGTLCLTLGFFFFTRAEKRDQTRDWLAAGVALGIGALSRSVILFIGLALAISHIPWRHSNTRAGEFPRLTKFRSVALFLIALASVILVWGVRNYAALGSPVVGSTLTGYNLYRHNYLISSNNYLRYVGPDEATTAVRNLLKRRPDLTGTENEAQMDAVYREEALRIIASEPRRYILLSAYRFFALWFNWGVGEVYGKSLTIVDYLIFGQQALLLSTAVIGLCATWHRTWRLGMVILIVSLLHMAVVGQLRYIIPVMPLTITLSAIGCRTVCRRCLRQHKQSVC